MNKRLPGIVVTGASGFIGRNFVEASVKRYRLFCLARRSQQEAGVPRHKNIRWTQTDISTFINMQEVADSIKNCGGADYLLHLAGYYDFNYTDHPEYQRTNVVGTENVLRLAGILKIKRFIFTSSLAACKFGGYETIITENSPADAGFPYAVSKRLSESAIRKYSGDFSYAIVRLAAVFSDWCEYPPLFMFLSTWLSRSWKSRILGGKGESSITYIHIHDLIRLLGLVIKKDKALPEELTLIASPSGTVSHNDLYSAAVKLYYGKYPKPARIPKVLAYPGVLAMHSLSRLFGRESFEKPWMIKYVDKRLVVDSSFTMKILDWEPSKRNDILRRLLFLLENRKNHNITWSVRNEVALTRIAERSNILFYDILRELRDATVVKLLEYILLPENEERFYHYQIMGKNLLRLYIAMIYQLIATSLRRGDRILLRKYAQIIAYRRFIGGFRLEEINNFLGSLESIILTLASPRLETPKLRQQFRNYLNMNIQLVMDEIEGSFETYAYQVPRSLTVDEKFPSLKNTEELRKILSHLEDTFYDSVDYLDADFPSAPLI